MDFYSNKTSDVSIEQKIQRSAAPSAFPVLLVLRYAQAGAKNYGWEGFAFPHFPFYYTIAFGKIQVF